MTNAMAKMDNNGRIERLETCMAKIGRSNQLIGETLSVLVDEVANGVKGQIKEEMAACAEEIEKSVIASVDDRIAGGVKDVVDSYGLNGRAIHKLSKARNRSLIQVLGGVPTDRYQLLIKFYQSALSKAYRAKFNVSAYGDINPSEFDEALKFIETFNVDENYDNWCFNVLSSDYENGELTKKQEHAYERFFGIVDEE